MAEIETILEQLDFEDIEPFITATGEGDTGLTSRLKLKRNFEKIRNAIVAIVEEGVPGGGGSQVTVGNTNIYDSWVKGMVYYYNDVNPHTGLTETSLVWWRGKLWMCCRTATAQEPRWGCSDWRVVMGDTTYLCEILSSAGSAYHGGNVSTILAMDVRFGQENITELLSEMAVSIEWTRMTRFNEQTKSWERRAEDVTWTPRYAEGDRMKIVVERNDMGSGWMIDYRQAAFRCTVTINSSDEPFLADYLI